MTDKTEGPVWLVPGVALYVTLLLLGTHMPEERLPFPLPHEEVLHFLAYGGLALLVFALLRSTGEGKRWGAAPCGVATLLIVALFAITDELTQIMTRRSFEWSDFVADMAGASGAVLVACRIGRAKLIAPRHGPPETENRLLIAKDRIED